jgi:hypothetical protein
MTQQEFDTKLIELKKEKYNAIKQVEAMQVEVKEEIVTLKRQMSGIHKNLHKLEQQRMAIGARRIQIEAEWGKRISEFVSQRPNQSSNLGEVTTVNIIHELKRRGYDGRIVNTENPDDCYDINKQFSHDGTV